MCIPCIYITSDLTFKSIFDAVNCYLSREWSLWPFKF